MLIEPEDWAHIESGVVQRAALLRLLKGLHRLGDLPFLASGRLVPQCHQA